jgi:hypothetical protein
VNECLGLFKIVLKPKLFGVVPARGLDDCFDVVEEGWVVSGENEEYGYGQQNILAEVRAFHG